MNWAKALRPRIEQFSGAENRLGARWTCRALPPGALYL